MGEITREERKQRLAEEIQKRHDKVKTFVNTSPNLGVEEKHGDLHQVSGGADTQNYRSNVKLPSDSHQRSVKP